MNAVQLWAPFWVLLLSVLILAGVEWALRRRAKPLPQGGDPENSATARDSSRGRVLIPYITHDAGRPELWLGYMDDARTFVPVAGPEPVPRHWQALQRWENRP